MRLFADAIGIIVKKQYQRTLDTLRERQNVDDTDDAIDNALQDLQEERIKKKVNETAEAR